MQSAWLFPVFSWLLQSAFVQLLPVLVIVIISVITQLLAANPPYSLFYKSTLGYTISRETQNLQVPYFVDKNFDKAYRGASLRDLEKTIEKDYIDYVQTSCWKEKQQKSELTNLAGLYRDERLRQKAESLKLENCDKLSKLIGLRRGGWEHGGPAQHGGFLLVTIYMLLYNAS